MLGGRGTTQVLIDLEFIRKENGIEMDTDEFAIHGADRNHMNLLLPVWG